MKSAIRIVEVSPRDGLQNEKITVPTQQKIRLIEGLAAAGLRSIEVTSFVHPEKIPQLADAEQVVSALPPKAGIEYFALVPNERGLDRALNVGITGASLFTTTSKTFSEKNVDASLRETLATARRLIARCRAETIRNRVYISTSFVCPFEGEIRTEQVVAIVEPLLEEGAQEIVISDTIGAAVPSDVDRLLSVLLRRASPERWAVHFHDTYGTALANSLHAVEMGVTTVDASAGGLGGCPFAPGAAGNLATEDLDYALNRSGYQTGVDLTTLATATKEIAATLKRPLSGRNWQRLNRTNR